MTPSLLFPEGAVLLHIGPQKTGSTSIQQAMHRARDEMARHGVFYPGPGVRPAEAGWAVMGTGPAVGRPRPRIELWEQLVREVRQTPLARSCVSDEDFGRAGEEAARRIVTDLGADQVHLVYVARRLDRLLPSQWQERVKARMTWPWAEFLERMLSGPTDHPQWVRTWSPQLVGQVVERWSRFVPRERITVIVSDEGRRDFIPGIFEQMLGLPESLLVERATGSNRSLTWPEAEAVRRVNSVFEERGWTGEQYWQIVQLGVAGTLKRSATTDTGPRPGFPQWAVDLLADRADEQVEAIGSAGVTVVGDPEQLRLRGRTAAAPADHEHDAVSLELLGRVVEGAVLGALELQRRRLRAQRRRLQPAAHSTPSAAVRRRAARLLARVRSRRGGR